MMDFSCDAFALLFLSFNNNLSIIINLIFIIIRLVFFQYWWQILYYFLRDCWLSLLGGRKGQ